MSRGAAIVLGGIGPLTSPGIAWAGRELLAGMELAVEHVNAGGGSGGRRLELVFEDSHGDPDAGIEALGRLHAAGACAVVGEFHSVVANAVAQQADRMAMPFLCSSATLDAITARRSPYVFRLAPPQSRGWTIYADFVLAQGFRQVIEIIHEDLYWTSGAEAIRRRLEPAGVRVARVPVNPEDSASTISDRTAALAGAESRSIALLLVGYPQPLGAIVRALAERGLLTGALALGDPAGRAIFPDWWETTGAQGATASFLSYQLPGQLTQKGWKAADAFRERKAGSRASSPSRATTRSRSSHTRSSARPISAPNRSAPRSARLPRPEHAASFASRSSPRAPYTSNGPRRPSASSPAVTRAGPSPRRTSCGPRTRCRATSAASPRLADEQPEVARAVRRFNPRSAIELAQDVAHMHVDGAWAQEQVVRDLAIRAPH